MRDRDLQEVSALFLQVSLASTGFCWPCGSKAGRGTARSARAACASWASPLPPWRWRCCQALRVLRVTGKLGPSSASCPWPASTEPAIGCRSARLLQSRLVAAKRPEPEAAGHGGAGRTASPEEGVTVLLWQRSRGSAPILTMEQRLPQRLGERARLCEVGSRWRSQRQASSSEALWNEVSQSTMYCTGRPQQLP